VGADTTIATLRLRSAGADSPALRLRAARQLQAAALAPPGLPPAAVLVVRRLADPMPGRFGGSRLRPHPEWERAVRDELAALARAAARPDGYGRLPPDAPAVLFGDEAELIACLLGDRARGVMFGHWWWRSVLPRLALPRALARDAGRDPAPVLCARPREVPAAVSLLARWGQAGRVAAALSPPGAARALAALAREHSLPPALVEPSSLAVEVVPFAARRASARVTVDRASADEASLPVPSPFTEWAPLGVEAGAVPPEVHCLFAVAAGLHAAPARVRSSALVSRARRWWAAAGGTVAQPELGPPSSERQGPAVTQAARTSEGDGPAVARDAPLRHPEGHVEAARDMARPGAPAGKAAVARGSRRRATTRALARPAASPPPPRPRRVHDTGGPTAATESAAVEPRLRGVRPARGHRPASVAPTPPSGRRRPVAAAASPEPPRAPVPQEVVPEPPSVIPGNSLPTRLGGLFYLIHALQDLGLPETFDARWHVEAGGPWGTLDVLARAIFGPRLADVSADPAWTALAALADWGARRTRASRGGGACDPPFRVPKTWPARLRDPLDQLRWATAGGRVWLWSAAGYLVAHRRWRGAAAAAVRREAALLAHDAPVVPRLLACAPEAMPWTPPPSAPDGCPPRLRRWAAAVAPALQHRLALALGARTDVAARLMVPARLYLTSSHVDVVMKARDADLRVRAAGLDRDPGWLPAYGRVVYFHFE
jgi:hypothetical protein